MDLQSPITWSPAAEGHGHGVGSSFYIGRIEYRQALVLQRIIDCGRYGVDIALAVGGAHRVVASPRNHQDDQIACGVIGSEELGDRVAGRITEGAGALDIGGGSRGFEGRHVGHVAGRGAKGKGWRGRTPGGPGPVLAYRGLARKGL